ncbi:MAG TPA: VOC family protein [Phycisphaerales bacterium]|nr:VOC family protein [Phycisphaerales bacterium]
MTNVTVTGGLITGGMPTIFVSDMNKAIEFYIKTLGLKLEFRAGDHFASIDAGNGLKLGIHPPSEKAAKPGTRGAIEIGFRVSGDIDHAVAELSRRGVKFHGPVVDDKQVKLAFFSDPDGNPLYLSQMKPWG